MTGTALGIVLDGALMLMLGVAIYFGVRLNRQMTIIRSGREEFEKLINEFGTATKRAETALSELKTEVARGVETARTSSLKAAELCDDLEFLIKRGEKTADALERGIRGDGETTEARGNRVLTASDEDRVVQAAGSGSTARSRRPSDEAVAKKPAGGGAPRGSGAKKAKAKSKSELLKALQDMR